MIAGNQNIIPILVFTFLLGCQTTNPASKETNDSYLQGNQWLQTYFEKTEASSQTILTASQIRKDVSNLHIKRRKATTQDAKNQIRTEIQQLTQKMKELRQNGAKLRTQASVAKLKALESFAIGMQEKFADQVEDPTPISLAENKSEFMAHNPFFIAADPRVRARQATIAARDAEADSLLSIRERATKEQNAPTNLNLSSFQISKDHKILAHIEVLAEKEDGPVGVPLNEIHNWRLVLSDLDGRPLDVEVEFDGHMPGHVHGLPTQPRVTQKLASGSYLVEGVKFQMRGWWVIDFKIADDRVRFNILL